MYMHFMEDAASIWLCNMYGEEMRFVMYFNNLFQDAKIIKYIIIQV